MAAERLAPSPTSPETLGLEKSLGQIIADAEKSLLAAQKELFDIKLPENDKDVMSPTDLRYSPQLQQNPVANIVLAIIEVLSHAFSSVQKNNSKLSFRALFVAKMRMRSEDYFAYMDSFTNIALLRYKVLIKARGQNTIREEMEKLQKKLGQTQTAKLEKKLLEARDHIVNPKKNESFKKALKKLYYFQAERDLAGQLPYFFATLGGWVPHRDHTTPTADAVEKGAELFFDMTQPLVGFPISLETIDTIVTIVSSTLLAHDSYLGPEFTQVNFGTVNKQLEIFWTVAHKLFKDALRVRKVLDLSQDKKTQAVYAGANALSAGRQVFIGVASYPLGSTPPHKHITLHSANKQQVLTIKDSAKEPQHILILRAGQMYTPEEFEVKNRKDQNLFPIAMTSQILSDVRTIRITLLQGDIVIISSKKPHIFPATVEYIYIWGNFLSPQQLANMFAIKAESKNIHVVVLQISYEDLRRQDKILITQDNL